MQTDDVELEFTPSILDTPSLMTPNIVFTVPTIRSAYNPLHINNGNLSISNPSSITTTNETASSTSSSAEVKVSKIEDELKQSLGEGRKPTPSPFEKMSSTNGFILDKPSQVITTDDGTTIEIPSTADVVKELEALTNTNSLNFQDKPLINDHNDRETTTIINGDNIRYDLSNKSVMVSPPKKTFLIRSQSHTEPTSPIPNNLSQSQKANNNDHSILNTQNGLDDENSMDDHFTRIPDLSSIIHSNETNFKPMIDNQHLPLRTDQNGISNSIIKQQPIVVTNKRTFGNMAPLTKANTIFIPQPSLNEVTSTDQLSNVKRQRTAPTPVNTTIMNFRPSFPPAGGTTVTNTSPTHGSDDQRKKQIRDSNREAARRCRERRRQYIEQLEGNLEHHKGQIKQLTDKLARIERENTQLRAILSETKILHSASSRISLNESHVDYTNVLTAAGIDINCESNHQTDGGTIQRNYLNRNNL
jgi:hypothetical protein